MNQIISKIEIILDKQGRKGIVFKELLKRTKLKSKQVKLLRGAIAQLKEKGIIIEKHNKIIATKYLGLIPAKIARINKTFGFAESIEDNTEYFIPGKFLLGALPDDTVLLKEIPSKKGSKEAEVKKITAYSDAEFVGKLVENNGNFFIEADSLMKFPLMIKKCDLNSAKAGDKVLAKVTVRGTKHSLHKAVIVSTFGNSNSAKASAMAILEVNGISNEFPYEVVDKAKFIQKRGILPKDYDDRLDLRNEIIFTIDSADSKDLDDAVSLAKFDDCYQLGVHIADVSHYVKYKSEIDMEAFYRGTSIYYANKVVPMLPKELSNGICSLNPNEDRLCLSALITLDLEGNLIDFDFAKTVIRSKVKGVYSEINQILNHTASEEMLKKYKMVMDKIFLMKELADIRTNIKINRGAPEIVTNESKIIVDENDVAIDIKPRQTGASETLIEEFMLLANEACAIAGKMKEVPFVYRIHEKPTPEKLDNLNTTLKLLGLSKKPLGMNVKPMEIAQILRKSKDTDFSSIINVQVLRAMSKARYSENPLGHYGLALENYAHFTSPIRRYPDLVVHRVISDILAYEPIDVIKKKYEKYVIKSALQATKTEINAMKIERSCEDCYKAEYMTKHIGEEFEGIISSVASHGIYVELPNTVEGLIRAEELPDGEYYFDEVMSFKNMTTGQSFKIGDKVKITCVKADVNSGKIDFLLVK